MINSFKRPIQHLEFFCNIIKTETNYWIFNLNNLHSHKEYNEFKITYF